MRRSGLLVLILFGGILVIGASRLGVLVLACNMYVDGLKNHRLETLARACTYADFRLGSQRSEPGCDKEAPTRIDLRLKCK